jgi:hypothetical protein
MRNSFAKKDQSTNKRLGISELFFISAQASAVNPS